MCKVEEEMRVADYKDQMLSLVHHHMKRALDASV